MKRAGYALLAFVLIVGISAPLSAHHSFAAHYDMTKQITVQGAIAEIRLANPHSWFYLEVKEADGTVTRWAFEAGTPSGMIRNGYKASELPRGTMVTITGFHARDQSKNVGMLRQLTTADGRPSAMRGAGSAAGGAAGGLAVSPRCCAWTAFGTSGASATAAAANSVQTIETRFM